MSLSDLYQNTKKEKKDHTEKVLLSTHAMSLKHDIENLSSKINSVISDIVRLEEAVKRLESLKMNELYDKHKNMKESYNSLVTSYNTSQAELKTVVMDLAKRMNELESKF